MGNPGAALASVQIAWPVINRCRSTALEPEQVRYFVTAFVQQAKACAVIGTEVSMFPSLAKDFGEAALTGFLSRQPIGDAIRQARLDVLKKGNPLGFVYVPYVVAIVVLSRAKPPASGP